MKKIKNLKLTLCLFKTSELENKIITAVAFIPFNLDSKYGTSCPTPLSGSSFPQFWTQVVFFQALSPFCLLLFAFLRATACNVLRVLAVVEVSVRLSVRPSVRPSHPGTVQNGVI